MESLPIWSLSRNRVKNYSKRGRWARNAGVEADARERADLAFGVAKNPIARVSILARFYGPSRGRFRHGHNLYLLAMTVAVVSEAQAPKNGRFIAAEAVPGVTPGRSHTDP